MIAAVVIGAIAAIGVAIALPVSSYINAQAQVEVADINGRWAFQAAVAASGAQIEGSRRDAEARMYDSQKSYEMEMGYLNHEKWLVNFETQERLASTQMAKEIDDIEIFYSDEGDWCAGAESEYDYGNA